MLNVLLISRQQTAFRVKFWTSDTHRSSFLVIFRLLYSLTHFLLRIGRVLIQTFSIRICMFRPLYQGYMRYRRYSEVAHRSLNDEPAV